MSLGKINGIGGSMNGRKIFSTIQSADQHFRVHPSSFVFFDKKTGTRRFEAKANEDGSLPVDYAASLLAVHCVLRDQDPEELGVMVQASEDLLGELAKRAQDIIQNCQIFETPVRLTKRQREILHEILQNLSNKEIAEKTNVSVRTVKFHVSTLLAKFDVANRMGLMQKIAGLSSADRTYTRPSIPQLVVRDAGSAKGHTGRAVQGG
jgi:DNA-binding NarL/FixJ family response regulator